MGIRGVSFRVPQGRNDLLQEILDGIDIQTFCWYNIVLNTDENDGRTRMDIM